MGGTRGWAQRAERARWCIDSPPPPHAIYRHPPDAVDILLQDIPLVDAVTRAQLLLELAAYRAIAIGDPALTGASDVEAWWASKDGDVTIKTWYETATKVMLLQPSSAAAERVFSMLKALMGDQQASKALQDYQQAALMIHYNQLQRRTRS